MTQAVWRPCRPCEDSFRLTIAPSNFTIGGGKACISAMLRSMSKPTLILGEYVILCGPMLPKFPGIFSRSSVHGPCLEEASDPRRTPPATTHWWLSVMDSGNNFSRVIEEP